MSDPPVAPAGGPPSLSTPLRLGSRLVRNRVVFGPHETNLARRRSISERHVAYYRRRAAGGAGTIVIEEASVHPSDWPYERAPLAVDSAPGWAAVAAACHDEGAIVLAALGHAGGQGSSAYGQAPLWAPSRVPEVTSREVPKWMESEDVDAVVEGFAVASGLAMAAGLDGVEVNAGQHSLLRQFLSGLTNQRHDRWGQDRTLLLRTVLEVAGGVVRGEGRLLGLRLSCDELAPWAGIVPAEGAQLAARLAPLVDYLVVVRGSIFTVGATRPDGHTLAGFNRDLTAAVRAAIPTEAPTRIVAQGSIVDPDQAAAFLAAGLCDLVEMTRAQIADPELARKVAAGRSGEVRPCVLCNQWCQVRDSRNPVVSCVGEPAAGHELDDHLVFPASVPPSRVPGEEGAAHGPLLVVGGGPAGLECARVAALSGLAAVVVERHDRLGGAARLAAVGAGHSRFVLLIDWLEAECRRLGVDIRVGEEVEAPQLTAHPGPIVLCTGSSTGPRDYTVAPGATVLSAAEMAARLGAGPSPAGTARPPAGASPGRDLSGPGKALVWDPLGGPIGVGLAEALRAAGHAVSLVTPDLVVGQQLSLSGDLAAANARLQLAGVELIRRSLLREVRPGSVVIEDRFTGEGTSLPTAVVIDAGPRLPDDALWRAAGGCHERAGDAVAPRTVGEAILEGRRSALAIAQRRASPPVGAAR